MDMIEIVSKFFGGADVKFVDGGFATWIGDQVCNGWTFTVDGKPFDVWTKNGAVLQALPV